MNEEAHKLNEALKRKDCTLPVFVKLLVKQLQITEAGVKRLLFELRLHKLKPNEEESFGYMIQLTDEEIIKNYLLNNKMYDNSYHAKNPMLIKWDKADLITWLNESNIETPAVWEEWIEKDYPVLIKHNLVHPIKASNQDSQNAQVKLNMKESLDERNARWNERLKVLMVDHKDITTHADLCKIMHDIDKIEVTVDTVIRCTKSRYGAKVRK